MNQETSFKVYIAAFLASYFETVIDYPITMYKIIKQSNIQKPKFPSQFIRYYQGLYAYQASLIPTTMTQIAINNFLRKNNFLSHAEYAHPIIGGAFSAFLVTPIERIILCQQKYRISARDTYSIICSRSFFDLWIGLETRIVRESIFSFGVWFLNAKLKSPESPVANYFLLPEIISGTIASALSHPADLIGTLMQNPENKLGLKDLTKSVYKNKGFSGFFLGFVPRNLSIITYSFFVPRFYTFFHSCVESQSFVKLVDNQEKRK